MLELCRMNLPVVSAAWLPPIRAWVYRSTLFRAVVPALPMSFSHSLIAAN